MLSVLIIHFAHESFHVIRPNLLEVRAPADPNLSGLVIFYVWADNMGFPDRSLGRMTWNDSSA